jgi:hypothetical protein
MDPRNRFQGNDSAGLCSLAGWYDNPFPSSYTLFLAPIDCSKIPAEKKNFLQEMLWLKVENYASITTAPRNNYQKVDFRQLFVKTDSLLTFLIALRRIL